MGNPFAASAEAVIEPTVAGIMLRLLGGLLVGLLVGWSYYFAQRKRLSGAWPFMTTLILLTILVGATTLVIGDSISRAFGLVGALSIVRFRTIVEDTRDTAFVIYAVIMGMAIGSGNAWVAVCGIPITSATAIGMHILGRNFAPQAQHVLEVRLGAGVDPEAALAPVIAQHLVSSQLVSATTARQGAALEIRYHVQLRDPLAPLTLVRDLNKTEGVQQVDLREVKEGS